ncbi:RNA ligase/cyclic nucleotide phosphodiesterase [Coniochaeta sp. 2T2.1]|nr:RNA ligase/cyclic nucleotide phosphodiesterase [Coniochaeta sp. 2T2.1]
MSTVLQSTDALNKLEDLSGVEIKPGENPYDALIRACRGDPADIQALYSAHRVRRNGQQRQKFLSKGFTELIIDPFLLRLERPVLEPGFRDPRNCLVFWARPPEHVVKLATHLQALLRKAAPNLWLMPPQRMHLTALEVTHSKTPEEIAALVEQMRPAIPTITNYTFKHRSRLVKPMLSYDLAAIALSFLPAAVHPGFGGSRVVDTDLYSYHHLRRDVFDISGFTGVNITSRYVVPSAHITLGRYLGQEDHLTHEMRRKWVDTIDDINKWLETQIWDQDAEFTGEWIVGQERGLEVRSGPLWYGGGRSIMAGEGF